MKLAGGNQQCQLPLHITLVAPDDLHTLEIDEDFQVDHNQILALFGHWLHNLAKKTTIILIFDLLVFCQRLWCIPKSDKPGSRGKV